MKPSDIQAVFDIQFLSPGWASARCCRCAMQQCAPSDSLDLSVFLELHVCNGQQHVAMSAIEQIVRERKAIT
jgi:hypothetical protein